MSPIRDLSVVLVGFGLGMGLVVSALLIVAGARARRLNARMLARKQRQDAQALWKADMERGIKRQARIAKQPRQRDAVEEAKARIRLHDVRIIDPTAQGDWR